MTREQMIDVLEEYCNGNICDSCEFCNDCEKGMVFSEIVDEKLKDYVSRIDGKNTDAESQNVCELVGEKMEQVKVLKEVTRMIYPNRMEEVIPIKEFVKNITDKGYKVMIRRENVIGGKYDVVIYEEEELKE
jgi:hypothetical protein